MDVLSSFSDSLRDRYEIERQIGAGGMATVYLARDLRHERPVALKLLSPELGAVLGPERFLSEIRVTANLQHPNLLPLFDSGEADGRLYYVMPYVEGETLRARLDRERQLPVDEAVRIAVAVASALDYAHRHGVIHRDLKPENILLHDGQPLVADFGIALAVSNAGGERVTQSGLSLGTPQYMSPEQATGDRVIDPRTDVYSLGAVLYEMLTGDPPHTGSTAQAIIARLLTEKPRSVRSARPAVPEHVEAVVHKALEKLPADRFSTAREFADALTHPETTLLTRASAAVPGIEGKTGRRAILSSPWISAWAAVATIAVIALAVWQWRHAGSGAGEQVVRFSVDLPEGGVLAPDFSPVIIAPDGQRIFYPVSKGGTRQLYSRRLADLYASPVAGTEGAYGAFISPDGKSIAFYRDNKLFRLAASGGVPTVVTEVTNMDNAAWLKGNRILMPTSIFTGGRSGLSLIPAGGGRPRPVLKSDSARGENHATPVVLEDGETVVFNDNGPSGYDDDHIAIGSLKTGKYTALDVLANRAIGVLEGHVLYVVENGTLMALPVDVRAHRATGDPFPLLEGIADGWDVDISATGSLVYVEGNSTSSLMYVDAAGNLTPALAEPRAYAAPRFSPDGRRIAFTVGGQQTAIWIADIANNTLTRLATGQRPTWTPDGKRIAYQVSGGGKRAFMWVPFDGSEQPQPVPIKLPLGAPQDIVFSPDGRTAMYRITSRRRGDLYYAQIGSDSSPVGFATGPADENAPEFSPDGRWVAYVSNESGATEVYVRRFPGPSGRLQVSTGGGTEPVWGPDGRTLMYRVPAGIIAATLGGTETLEVTGRTVRYKGNFPTVDRWANFDITPDGKRLLIPSSADAQLKIVWVTNWISELRSRIRSEKER